MIQVVHATFDPLPALESISGWAVMRKAGGKKLYHFNLFSTKERADQMAKSISATKQTIEVNCSYDRPYKLID